MIEGRRLAEWLSRLVRVPSVAPAQAGPRAGAPGEAALAAAVVHWFREFGGEVHQDEVLPGRSNIYATWKGRSDGWKAVDAHLDTVGVEQMAGDPFSGEIRDGRVYGRGAVDTKATLAVVLALLEALHQSGRRPEANLLVAATVDEEVSAQGAPVFARWVREQGLRLDELAVAEPTGCGPVYAHKGGLRLEFTVQGHAVHSSQPHLGKNAIAAASRLILALEEEHGRLAAAPPPGPLGPGTLAVTLIQGGSGGNVIPDACSLTVDRRLVPGEEIEAVKAGLLEVARRHCPLPLEARASLEINPFFQDPHSPWVGRLAAWSGREPGVVPYGTNAWAYDGLARECVVIGPGSIEQAHGDVEWVEVSELEKLAGIYARWWRTAG
jgi:acetylornithine deacetylase/succinyl-diaminopimelate desuccinylase-like protein